MSLISEYYSYLYTTPSKTQKTICLVLNRTINKIKLRIWGRVEFEILIVVSYSLTSIFDSRPLGNHFWFELRYYYKNNCPQFGENFPASSQYICPFSCHCHRQNTVRGNHKLYYGCSEGSHNISCDIIIDWDLRKPHVTSYEVYWPEFQWLTRWTNLDTNQAVGKFDCTMLTLWPNATYF